MKEMIRLNRRDFEGYEIDWTSLILNIPIESAVVEQAFTPGPFIRD